MGGRYQISSNGVALIDGVPFGRPAGRAAARPQVHIPPLKRRRLTYDDAGTGATNGVDDSISLSDIDGSSEQLLLVNSGEVLLEEAKSTTQPKRITKEKKSVRFGFLAKEDTDEDDEEDEDFNPAAVDGESLGDSSETESSEEEVSDTDTSSSDSESSSDEDSDSDSANPDTAKRMSDGTKSAKDKSKYKKESRSNVTKQSKKSANKYTQNGLGGLDGAMDSEEEGDQPAKTTVPPGKGLRKTQRRNRRKRVTKKLKELISAGQLPPNSTKADYLRLLEHKVGTLKFPSRALALYMLRSIRMRTNRSTTRANRMRSLGQTRTLQRIIRNREMVGQGVRKVFSVQAAKQSMELQVSSQAGNQLESRKLTVSEPRPHTATDAEEPLKKRQRRNIDVANRFIFRSLGIGKVPKTDEEKENARHKLSKQKGSTTGLFRATPTPTPDPPAAIPNTGDVQAAHAPTAITNAGGAQAPDVPTAITNAGGVSVPDAWKSKIILSAVECLKDGVVLSTPPFPFVQRWDPQQQLSKTSSWERQQGKKRKRQGREQYGREDYGQEADEEEYYEVDESTTILNYDDETENLDSSMVQGEVESQIMNDIAAASDLPLLPATLDNLQPLTVADIVPGTVIAYKVLEVSAATSWAPAISPYKTAMIVKDNELSGSTFKVELALRDRVQPKYDDKGERVFEKFEMIMEADEQDDGIRVLSFEELYEPKIVAVDNVDVHAAGDEETNDVTGENEAVESIEQTS